MPPLEPEASLTLVTFNGWVGNPDWRANLTLLANDTDRPHVLALQEAYRFGGTIRGYRRLACSHRDDNDAQSTIVLVRDDVPVTRHRCLHVDGPDWIGPKHGIRHDPRTFRDLTVEVDGTRFDVLAVHRTPGGPQPGIKANAASWAAEDAEIVSWATRREARHPDRPQVVIGDHNGRTGDDRPLGIGDLAARLGAVARLRGIDGALVAEAGKVTARKLDGRYGSDAHEPVVVTVTA